MDRGKHTEYEMKLRKAIAHNISKLLKEKSLSQKHLSELTSIPTSTLSDYLNSKSLALPGNIQKIAIALNVSKKDIDPSFDDSAEIPISRNGEHDIARDLERMMANLESENALAFDGEPMTDEDRELLKDALEHSLKTARIVAKKKYTPNKYKKD